MKYTLILSIFILPISLLLSSYMKGEPSEDKFSIAHSIMHNVSQTLSARYNMHMGGIIEATHRDDKCYKTIGLSFQIRRMILKEEGRKMLIDCAKELLNQINAHPDFQQFMHDYPFEINNINVKLYVSDETGRRIYHPKIAVFSLSNGNLYYRTNSPENRYVFFSEEKETYEEALRIIEKSN